MISERTIELIGRRYLRISETRDFIDWAGIELQDGNDTESLRILAGMNDTYPTDVEFYFKRALFELCFEMPLKDEFLKWYIVYIARKILSGEISSSMGCSILFKIYVETGQPDYLKVWDSLSADLHPETYEELTPKRFDTVVREYAGKLVK
jgi:hypothetical protein